MNYLGHLYFSNDDLQLMQANLFGDFVKGKDLSFFPEKIQEGIILHRKIDSFIDQHPSVKDLFHVLYSDLPKVSGIAVDLYFDHLLAVHWNQFHTREIDVFINEFYTSVDMSTDYYSPKFQTLLSNMKEYNWLYWYRFPEGLRKACDGVSRRLSFPNELVNAPAIFEKHKFAIEKCFFEYMEDAKNVFSFNE